MAVYTKEYESQPEAILTNVIICPAVDLSANVAVPVHCQVENVLWDTGATNTLISQEVVNALGFNRRTRLLFRVQEVMSNPGLTLFMLSFQQEQQS